jgi:23S rRNA (guanosine2251-2'-O)-methyltransferase
MNMKKKSWPQKVTGTRRSTSAKSNLPPAGEYIIDNMSGINEYLRFSPEKIEHIIGSLPSRKGLLTERIPQKTKVWTPEEWDSSEHGVTGPTGIWALVKIQPVAEGDFLARINLRSPPIIIALDHVTDPRNLGAIARTCGFFGIRDLIVPQDRQVHLTSASVSTAQGAFALVDMAEVVNLGRTLEKLKESGYWIVGADMDGEPIGKVAGFYEKTVLVFGSEGSGLSQMIQKKCDRMIAIVGSEVRLESLNVSVAAGIIIREFSSAKSSRIQTNNA